MIVTEHSSYRARGMSLDKRSEERRRRLGQVYRLLLDLARQKKVDEHAESDNPTQVED